MSDRRKLIVVANRAPATYERDLDGNRVTRRGGGGLVTALGSLVRHHDVTWVASAMSDEDRAAAAEAGDSAIDETARDGSPYRLRLVAHDPQRLRLVLQRDREPGALVRPALPLGARQRARLGPRRSPRLDGGLPRGEPELRRRRRLGARARARGGRLLPRLPPLRGARLRAGAGPRRDARPLRPHPLGAAGLLARPPGPDPAGRPRGPPRERRRQLPHPSLADQLPPLLRRPHRREGRLRGATRRVSATT